MSSEENCLASSDDATLASGHYCPPYWEPTLTNGPWFCWPRTEVNSTVSIKCPEYFAFDTSHMATRQCGSDGQWSDFNGFSPVTVCFNPDILDMINDFRNTSHADITYLQSVITGARILEIVGYSISLAAIVIAFFILCYFRNLQCHRTSIHKQLLLSLLIRTVLDIVLHVDNMYRLQVMHNGSAYDTIGKVEGLCEVFEVFRQYTRFSVFTWMFVEGFYLNGMVTAAVFRKPNFKLYYFIGWILPVGPIISWAVTMHYTATTPCWFGYAISDYYWIIEAPRLLILVINLGFLINIIRILVTKLRESNTSETQQVRKTIKAAILLVPLLGVNSLLFLSAPPQPSDNKVYIVIHYYGSMFAISFQGFFVALLHCFMHGEVRMLLRRKWSGWQSSRRPSRRRMSSTTTTDVSRNDSLLKKAQRKWSSRSRRPSSAEFTECTQIECHHVSNGNLDAQTAPNMNLLLDPEAATSDQDVFTEP